jgi:transposase
LEPRLAEATAGDRVVFCRDAAHFVFAPFVGLVWCFQRLVVKAPSGRQRLNVLAALNAISHEIFTVENLTYLTSETVCELLRLLARTHQRLPITIILDNAGYQRCALVHTVAHELGIELCYLPSYSPNLNLIERFWRFIKKQCLDSKYYPESHAFQQAILTCIQEASTTHQDAVQRLLPLRFQTFQKVAVVGEQQEVSTGTTKKVLSKAA